MDDDLDDALCLTLIEGLSATKAVRMLVPEAQPFDSLDQAQAWVDESESYDRAWLAAGDIDGWAFIWENNGWQGTDETKLLALGRTTGSVFWNVNAQMRFVLVRDGLLRSFDPLFRADPDHDPTDSSGEPLAAEDGLDWESNPATSGLMLLCHEAGVTVADRAWLDRPGVTYWGQSF